MSRSAQSHSWLCPFNTKRCTKTFQVHLPYNSKNLFVFHLYPRYTSETIFPVSFNESSSFWYRIRFSVYTYILELSGKNADTTLWKSYWSCRVSEVLNRESKAITLYLIQVQSAYVLKFKKILPTNTVTLSGLRSYELAVKPNCLVTLPKWMFSDLSTHFYRLGNWIRFIIRCKFFFSLAESPPRDLQITVYK